MSRATVHRRLSQGVWLEVLPGVFRHAATPESWEVNLHAFVLWGGVGTVASHRSAAALWRLNDFPAGPLEISVPHDAPPRAAGRSPWLVCHRLARIAHADVTHARGIPVTRPARTLVDLATVLDGEDRIEAAIDAALRRRLLSVRMLWNALERVPPRGKRNLGLMRKLLERREGSWVATDSVLESRLLRILVEGGLRRPVPGFEVKEGRRVLFRIDLAYPRRRLAIEVDGYRYHRTRREWARDTTRANTLVERGWRVLRFTAEDLRAPDAVRRTVAEALGDDASDRAW